MGDYYKLDIADIFTTDFFKNFTEHIPGQYSL